MGGQLTAMQKSSETQSALSVVSFLQTAEVRAARECVRGILSLKPLSEWSADERRHASVVTANYDVVAAMLKSGLCSVELISANWGPSIRHCYEVLKPFIEEHRAKPGADPDYWSNFAWLYSRVHQRGTSAG